MPEAADRSPLRPSAVEEARPDGPRRHRREAIRLVPPRGKHLFTENDA